MKNTFLKLWAWATGSSVKLFNFLAPILSSHAATLLEKLAPIALAAVTDAAAYGASGDEKRKEAFRRIQAAAISEGIVAGADVINSALELAVLNLRSKGEIQ